jgi:signal transduction histidine kinase
MPGMRERATRAGGRLFVESAPGVGTEVGVVIEQRGGGESQS